MSLRNRFRMVLAGATLGMLALNIAWISNERSNLVKERKNKIRAIVEAAFAVLAQSHDEEQQGLLARDVAQKRALAILQRMRFDQSDYLWVHDTNTKMIMHPFRPDLVGKDLTNFHDPGGKAVFAEMVDLVRKQDSGFVTYHWPRPGQTAALTKISFVKEFPPWGWILGAGIYVDDVEADWRYDLAVGASFTLIIVGLILAVSETASRSIFHRLDVLVAGFNDLGAHGTAHMLETREERTSPPGKLDEIERVVLGFNHMLGEIQKRDHALARHREDLEREVETRTDDLRSANRQLAAAQTEMELFLASIPSILIGMDHAGRITRWNAKAANTFGVPANQAIGRRLDRCEIKWLHPDMSGEVTSWLKAENPIRSDDLAYERDGKVRFVGLGIRQIHNQGSHRSLIATGADITDKKSLEEQLRQAQKLEAVGQLASGIAHEINTPTQFVTHNTEFLKDSWNSVIQVLTYCRDMRKEIAEHGSLSIDSLGRYEELLEASDVDYLAREIPQAIDQSLDGLQRVAKIVRAMKEFSHPGSNEKKAVDINKVIETTVVVAHNEWRDEAAVITNLDPNLPLVPCNVSDMNQVILNLLVNAVHAIAETRGNGNAPKGTITIETRAAEGFVEISITDNGAGIPEQARPRIFEPFFTTKPLGKGTGQGLSLAHTLIVRKHQGKIWFKTKLGEGTTFYIRVPLQEALAKAE